ncbi:MAG: hypothetical protein ABIH82_06310 [Candidatus Woesearchaeota archaeon]
MKEVFVLEHADWNEHNNKLTDVGLQECHALKYRMPKFDIIMSSKADKNKITAYEITEKKPKVDSRAGESRSYSWWEEEPQDQKSSLLRGMYGGVTQPAMYRTPVKKAGEQLLELVKDLLKKLPEDGNALIVSHNRNMIAAEAILKKQRMVAYGHTFHSLQGFIIDENLKFKPFDGFS